MRQRWLGKGTGGNDIWSNGTGSRLHGQGHSGKGLEVKGQGHIAKGIGKREQGKGHRGKGTTGRV